MLKKECTRFVNIHCREVSINHDSSCKLIFTYFLHKTKVDFKKDEYSNIFYSEKWQNVKTVWKTNYC